MCCEIPLFQLWLSLRRAGGVLVDSVYKRVNYGPVIKSSAKLLPHSLSFTLAPSPLSCGFVCRLGRLPITLPRLLLPRRRHLPRLRVERTVTACTVEVNKEAHALSSLLTAQNRLADKRPRRSNQTSVFLRVGVFSGRAMWHEAMNADSLVFNLCGAASCHRNL